MNKAISKDRVSGFLRSKGKMIVNGKDEEIILSGWGLGNWLLCEGYMWKSYSGRRFDRPRHIEQVIKECAGSLYAEKFWTAFREHYITREDIKYMAELGYNSVRLPFNWQILMYDEPGFKYKEDGFAIIDRCIDWCEEFGIYIFLDMHGAPGGQTGANIDDSVDGLPRLFIDDDSFKKGVALWGEIARRYSDRYIVGGYDLLNEPIRPEGYDDGINCDHLEPMLEAFYEQSIAEIRKVDKLHMFSIEGHHWATDTAVFHKSYDENMVIHFHRYGCKPGKECYDEFLEVSERLNQPLWLGETGENKVEWFAAMYPLAVSLGFGYNLWPWKKMECTNSPCSVKMPKDWEQLMHYTDGGPKPSYELTHKILDEYIENMKLSNCVILDEVNNSVFRNSPFVLRATDFDCLPEQKGVSYSGGNYESLPDYHSKTGMCIKNSDENYQQSHIFDSGWDMLYLELHKGEFASYTVNKTNENGKVVLSFISADNCTLLVYQNDKLLASNVISDAKCECEVALEAAEQSTIKLQVESGTVGIAALSFK